MPAPHASPALFGLGRGLLDGDFARHSPTQRNGAVAGYRSHIAGINYRVTIIVARDVF
jgi:hypothetical protein